MKQLILILVINLLGLCIYAQNDQQFVMEWSKPSKYSGDAMIISASKSDDGYTIFYKEPIHGPGGFKFYFSKVDNAMNIVKTVDITEYIDEKKEERIVSAYTFNGNILLITARNFKDDNIEKVYVQKLNGDGFEVGEKIEIYQQKYKRNYRKLKYFFSFSPNKSYILLYLMAPYIRSTENQSVGLVLFDKNLDIKWNVSKELKVRDYQYSLLQAIVNDYGQVYFLAKNNKDAGTIDYLFGTRRMKVNVDNKLPYELLAFKDGELLAGKIKINYPGLTNLKAQFDENNTLHCVGYYSNDVAARSITIDGVVSFVIDSTFQNIVATYHKDFDKNFYFTGIYGKDKVDLKERFAKNKKINKYTTSLRMEKLIQHDNACISAVGEVSYLQVSRTQNGTDVDYRYDDLVISYILPTGEIVSNTRYIKKQEYNSERPYHILLYGVNNKFVTIIKTRLMKTTQFRENHNLIEMSRRDIRKAGGRDDVVSILTFDKEGHCHGEVLLNFATDEEHRFKVPEALVKLEDGSVLILSETDKSNWYQFARIKPVEE